MKQIDCKLLIVEVVDVYMEFFIYTILSLYKFKIFHKILKTKTSS